MNLDDLRAVQVDERETDSLRSLDESFYADVDDYLEGLRQKREAAAEGAQDPFDSADVRRVTDEIEAAEEVIEAIYERRIGKVVKQASLAAAGLQADDEGLTTEEADLFADLVERIRENRRRALGAVADDPHEAGAQPSDRGDETDEPAGDGGGHRTRGASRPAVTAGQKGSTEEAGGAKEAVPAQSASGGSEGEAVPERDTEDPRVTIRITSDLGEILGVDDRVYDLSAEDVVALPEQNAKPLLDRGVARKVD